MKRIEKDRSSLRSGNVGNCNFEIVKRAWRGRVKYNLATISSNKLTWNLDLCAYVRRDNRMGPCELFSQIIPV